eukprot:g2776.t1
MPTGSNPSRRSGIEKTAEDHQVKSEHLRIAAHRKSTKHGFKMAIRRWRLSASGRSTYVEYEVVCAAHTGDSINRWTLWKRYSQFRRLHRELEKSFGWQFVQSGAVFPPKTFFNDVSPAFNETRMKELNIYFKKIFKIPNIAAFDKHHSSDALRGFVEYATHINSRASTATSPRRPRSQVSSSTRYGGMRATRRSVRRPGTRGETLRHGDDGRSTAVTQSSASVPAAYDDDGAANTTSSASNAHVAASVRDDPRFAPFVKMLNMHLPMGAIRHKMTSSGFSDPEIEAFVSDSPTAASDSASLSRMPPTTSTSVRRDPKFAPFVKMLNMHLPMGAIRHKMGASGFSDVEIEAFATDSSISAASSSSISLAANTESNSSGIRKKPRAPPKRPSPAPRRNAPPAAQPGNLLAAIRGANKKKLLKKTRKKKKPAKPRGPPKGSMAAMLQQRLAARNKRLRKRESSHEVRRAANASAMRRGAGRTTSFAEDSDDDWE